MRTHGNGNERIITVQFVRILPSMGYKWSITISDHIRPCLRQEHRIGTDTRVYSCSPTSPIDRDWDALEQVGTEKCHGPDIDQNNHGPYCVDHSTVGEYPRTYFLALSARTLEKRISPSVEEKHS